EVAARYQALEFSTRLERLDGAVAAVEKRIRDLTLRAKNQLERNEFQQAPKLLAEAQRLRKQNLHLLELIKTAEERLVKMLDQIQRDRNEVEKPNGPKS